MEEKTRSNTANSLNFGMITGGAMIVFSLLLFILDMHLNRSVSWIGYLVMLAGMVYGTLEYRKKYTGGFLSYGKAFTSCFMIGLFAGILASAYFFVFVQFIHPGFIGEMLDQTRISMAESRPGMSEEQIEEAVEMSAKFMSAPWMAVWGLIAYTASSAVLSLLAAIFLKKEDTSLNSNF